VEVAAGAAVEVFVAVVAVFDFVAVVTAASATVAEDAEAGVVAFSSLSDSTMNMFSL
jgi:hypothetical protein